MKIKQVGHEYSAMTSNIDFADHCLIFLLNIYVLCLKTWFFVMYFVVSTVSADGQAPLGSKSAAAAYWWPN